MLLAVVREKDCVGCGKCLPACPVDAIIGAPKFMHSVLIDECIGCKLCVEPCPMDCIEMVETNIEDNSEEKRSRALKAKIRFQAKKQRMTKKEAPKLPNYQDDPHYREKIQSEIKAAIKRVNSKKDNIKENNYE